VSIGCRDGEPRAWVEDRRAIESFFLRDVDRDKIVLYGGS
jgi:hypothetical protein